MSENRCQYLNYLEKIACGMYPIRVSEKLKQSSGNFPEGGDI